VPQPAPQPASEPAGFPQPFFVPASPAGPAESPTLRAVRGLGPLVAERLLGALELAIDGLVLADVPAGLTAGVPVPPAGSHIAYAMPVGGGAPEGAVIMLDQLRWGATTRASDLVRVLGAHPVLRPLLEGDATEVSSAPAGDATSAPRAAESAADATVVAGPMPGTGTATWSGVGAAAVSDSWSWGPGRSAATTAEAVVAARHGAAYLALGVATAAAVVRELGLGEVPARVPAVLGLGLGAAVQVLGDVPLPAGYAPAALARRRAEYLLPQAAYGKVLTGSHCFALTETEFPASAAAGPAAFAGNGLVEVVPGGVLIRTGADAGTVRLHLAVSAGPPAEVDTAGWDEVVEVSWTAAVGSASVLGPAGPGEPVGRPRPGTGLGVLTPPWPGTYRLRVHATGRDDAADQDTAVAAGHAWSDGESYRLEVWPAPTAPDVVYKRSDRVGYRLRGEPQPPTAPRPEAAYRWVRQGRLREAATITVVTGLDTQEVLRAFGADPAAPTSMTSLLETFDGSPWVAVLAVDGAVVVVEDNGFQGSRPAELRKLSRRGRAASVFWNINALSRLSLARDGEVVAAFEPGLDPASPAAVPFLAGMDLADHRDRIAACLVALERFTGYAVQPTDIDRIVASDLAYLIPSH
jgi:hypothetical protein